MRQPTDTEQDRDAVSEPLRRRSPVSKLLQPYQRHQPIVLALPRGGVPVAAALCAPLDLIIAHKIGLPEQPELAMGAIAEGAESAVVRNEDVIAQCR